MIVLKTPRNEGGGVESSNEARFDRLFLPHIYPGKLERSPYTGFKWHFYVRYLIPKTV